jgi:F-box-like
MKIGSPINQEAYVHLPNEILQHIIFFVQNGTDSQHDLWACCLVSRQWFSAALPSLYESPHLQSRNFGKFLSTFCPPYSVRRSRTSNKRELGRHVKHLDMSALAYESSNSMTACLLNRVKSSLETFVAPAKSFS